jgi:hypothetical protein
MELDSSTTCGPSSLNRAIPRPRAATLRCSPNAYGKTTLAAIAQELEARGERTPAGRDRWAPAQVARMLAA